MYMNGTHQDTCGIHAGYMRDTWDTYPDNKLDNKPHVIPGIGPTPVPS